MSAARPSPMKLLPGAERIPSELLAPYCAIQAEMAEVREQARKRLAELADELTAANLAIVKAGNLGPHDKVNRRTGAITRGASKV